MNTAVKEVQVIKATITGEKTEKIRVAAYCRVSTDKDDQLNSFFAQMRYYRDYVRGNDKMVLVDIYADEGITGTELTKRDEMKRLIRDCKHKKIDRVLVKSVTRFARNSLECIETIRTMQSCGVSVLFENDHSLVAISYVKAKIKSRHFCRNSKCRLFCRPKMCYNVNMREVLAYLRRWRFELY